MSERAGKGVTATSLHEHDDAAFVRPWDWRKASAGVVPKGWRIFHAYDVNDNAACEPSYGLAASCEEPNEGSELCPDCIDVVRAEPGGRRPHERGTP